MAGLEAVVPPVFAAVVRTIGIVARLLAMCGGAGFGLLTRSTLPPSWQGQDDHGGKCQNQMLHVNSLDFFPFFHPAGETLFPGKSFAIRWWSEAVLIPNFDEDTS